jgi:hypothetical protein
LNAFERYFHAPFCSVRAYVFSKLFLALVALDAWMLMIGHAGRYGVGDFNVAHFAWLDRALPVPSAGLYVGVLLATGLLALAIVLCGGHPLALLALFALYTFSWAMSMLDSYQHHYFVSSVLLCLVFFPRLQIGEVLAPAADAGSSGHAPPATPRPLTTRSTPPASARESRRERRARRAEQAPAASDRAAERASPASPAHGSNDDRYALIAASALALYVALSFPSHPWLWFCACAGTLALATWLRSRKRQARAALTQGFGFNLLGATACVLYVFTSVAKMDAQWTAGYTMQRISAAGRVFAPLVGWAGQLGIPEARFWSLVSSSVIPLELFVALGYACAVIQDSSASRLPRWTALAAFWAAVSLHVGAEAMGLEIGWFSDYMLLFACCYLLPAAAIETLGLLLTRPAQLLEGLLDERDAAPRTGETAIAIAGSSGLLAGIAFLIDLPGAAGAAAAAIAVLLAIGARALMKQRGAEARLAALGVGAAAAIMWAAIALSSVRWDFYRYLGGDLSRRGETRAALEAFVKGERYAPKGETRRNKIEQLRRKLADAPER